MPLLAAALIASIATVPLAGGRLSALADVSLRWMPALLAAIALQVIVLDVFPAASPALLGLLHVASYAFAGAWVVANRRVPGLLFVGIGGALNALAIGANGGVMPASPGALDRAGMAATTGEFTNSAAVADPRLAALGDVWAIPAGLPLASVFSVGDVLLAIGAAYGLHVICSSRVGAAASRRLPEWIAPAA